MWAGPVKNWIRACDLMLDMEADSFVPGHGPITDKKNVSHLCSFPYPQEVSMKSAYLLVLTIWVFTFIFIPSSNYAEESCPYCCSRSAFLKEFVNLNNPNYEDQWEEWNECMMTEMGGVSTFDPEDSTYKKATQTCKKYEPTDWSDSDWTYMYPSSVQTNLSNGLTTPYFHMTSPLNKKSQYFFKGSFESDINDGSVISDGSSIDGKPVKSRFILELYYNSDQEELLKKWISENSINSIPAQFRKMILNTDSKMNPDKPIHEILLWEFEKLPVQGTIIPEKNSVIPDESINIKINNFKDRKGRVSREFNRILIHAEHGTITNGAFTFDLKAKAFRVGNGEIIAEYHTPMYCDHLEDIITLYNSCDINNTKDHPLENTEKHKALATKKIKIMCPPGTIHFLGGYERNFTRKEIGKTGNTITWEEDIKHLDKMEMGIQAKLRYLRGKFKGNGEYWDYYEIYDHQQHKYTDIFNETHKGKGPSHRLSINFQGGSQKPPFEDHVSSLQLIWNKDKTKLLAIRYPNYHPEVERIKTWSLVSKDLANGIETKEKEDRSRTFYFNIDTVPEHELSIMGGPKAFTAKKELEESLDKSLIDGGYQKGFYKRYFRIRLSID